MVELTDLNGFEPVNNWAKIPHPLKFIEATSVAVDSVNNVYVFNRGINPIMIFNKDGDFIDTWGEGKFIRPHSIFIDDEDFLYLVDDGGHCVYKMTSIGDEVERRLVQERPDLNIITLPVKEAGISIVTRIGETRTHMRMK